MIARKPDLTTEARIIAVISRTLRIPASRIYPYSRLRDDLLLDPVDVLLLIAKLESQFKVYLTSEEAEAIETVRDASFFIRRHAEA